MSENVKCPVCGKPAQWYGCSGCGDDMGTAVCKSCGATMPGIPLSELVRSTGSEPPPNVERCVVRG
jgi:predicted amidophosphoribosyltransferase